MMQLLNPLRRWLLHVKLGLLFHEVDEVNSDMADALNSKNFGTYTALAEFHTDLLVEIDTIRRKLAALS